MRFTLALLCLICSLVTLTGPVASDDALNADYFFTRGKYYKDQQSYPEAAKWLRRAAELGHAGAQNSLGVLHFSGLGVPQDYDEALKWIRRAADQGYAFAQRNVGYSYHTGKGVAQDYAEAEKWYLLSARPKESYWHV